MDIYKMSNKEINDLVIDFNKTAYGKLTKTLAYVMPTLFGIITIAIIIWSFAIGITSRYCFMMLFCVVPITLFIFLLSYVIGSVHYYKELRIYAKQKRK